MRYFKSAGEAVSSPKAVRSHPPPSNIRRCAGDAHGRMFLFLSERVLVQILPHAGRGVVRIGTPRNSACMWREVTFPPLSKYSGRDRRGCMGRHRV